MIGSGGCLTMRRLDLGAAQHSRHSGHEATLPSTVCCARMPTTVTTHARAAPQVEGMGLDIACTFNAAFEGLDLQVRGAWKGRHPGACRMRCRRAPFSLALG